MSQAGIITSSTSSSSILALTSSAITVGAGSVVTATNCIISTAINPAITGSGTINYGALVYTSNSTNNVTTKNLLFVT